MPLATYARFPDQFFAGDTVKLAIENPAFPAPEWTATLVLNGTERVEKEGTPDGAKQAITLEAADSADLTPGIFSWSIRMSNGAGEQQTVDSATTYAKQNPADGVTSWARECLILIRAHIKKRLPLGLAGHNVSGTPIQKIPIPDAIKIEQQLAARVAAEDMAERRNSGDDGMIQIAFERP